MNALEENVETLDLDKRSRILRSDAMAAASALDVDIVFADPPYDFDAWDRLLESVRADFVVAESGRPLEAQPGWSIMRSKLYGRTWVSFLERDEN